jgi:hypothetical protein
VSIANLLANGSPLLSGSNRKLDDEASIVCPRHCAHTIFGTRESVAQYGLHSESIAMQTPCSHVPLPPKCTFRIGKGRLLG